tara:strand:+ start:4355 stop:4687 length:333 start_codon:yes stop_codon:yes gene_type:complete
MNNYEEISAADYAALESTFKEILSSTGSYILEAPHLRKDLDDFIFEVSAETKAILQKYGQLDHIHKLELADYKEQMLQMKRKMVKMELQFKQVDNSIQAFKNTKKEDHHV